MVMPDPKTCSILDIAKWAKTESWADYMYEHDLQKTKNVEKGWSTVQRGKNRRYGGRHKKQN
jgi:hypothetical protein